MASWNNQSQPTSGGRPTANPTGGSLTKDDIQLKRLAPKATDASTLIQNVFELIKQNPLEAAIAPVGIIIAFSIAQQIISFPINILASFGGGFILEAVGGTAGQTLATFLSIGVSMALSFFFIFLSTVMMGGISILWLRILRGQTSSINDILLVKPFIIPLAFTSMLGYFAMGIGSIFLLIPGIIIGLGVGLMQFIVIDKNLKYIDALKASWEIMNGHKIELLILSIILFFLNFAGLLALCVGYLFTLAISLGVMVSFYDAIAEPGNAYGNNLGNAPDVFS